MTRTVEISNAEDVLDSRDIIERIEELENDEDVIQGTEEWDELHALRELAEEGEGSPDWRDGETLIRDSYFVDYAEQLADDIGAVNHDATWPANHIDWDAATNEIKMDYFSVDFDGVDYWIRA